MSRYQHTQQPKPVGTIVGAVLALGAVAIFLALMATGVINLGPKKKAPVSGPVGTVQGSLPGPASSGTGSGDATGTAAPAAPANQAIIRFSGRFDEKANTRKVETLCPKCEKPVDAGIPKCPFCNADIKWPEKVPCKFCSSEKPGACGVCQGSGNCPFCSKGPRMLMGVKPPCDSCHSSGKCPACEGSGACSYCDAGFYYPGRPLPPKPAKKTEPPPAPSPTPGTETPAAPAGTEGTQPAPDPAPATE